MAWDPKERYGDPFFFFKKNYGNLFNSTCVSGEGGLAGLESNDSIHGLCQNSTPTNCMVGLGVRAYDISNINMKFLGPIINMKVLATSMYMKVLAIVINMKACMGMKQTNPESMSMQ